MSVQPLSSDGALFAEFDDVEEASKALRELQARGYATFESYSPFPVDREQPRRGGAWLGLALVTFAAGAVGGLSGYLIQWYANARSYPLDIGGRPTHAAPAFVYPALEAAILFAGLAIFLGLFVALKLPRLWRPEFEIDQFERVSDDRVWLSVRLGSGGGDLDRTTRELHTLRARRVVHAMSEA